MISAKVTRKVIHDTDKGIKKGISQAIAEIAAGIEGQAVLLSPVDTGMLRQSITRQVEKDSAVVGSNLEYALYQEEGTRRMPAANSGKGYFKPAVEKVRQKLTAIVGKAIRIGIRSS